MLDFVTKRVLSVGEAMIEMAVVGEDTYRRSFAGDTFNTAWHMSQLPELSLDVGFVTRVGTDTISDSFVELMLGDGLETSGVARDPDRGMGLYMIELSGAERSFNYWRDTSAARRLADDEAWLDSTLQGAGLVHVSGITLGILDAAARNTLRAALERARKAGTRVSFDPNVRPRLWNSLDDARAAMGLFLGVCDVALPSFDDEAMLWGDETPKDTIARMRAHGVNEVVVKNGAEPVSVGADKDLEIPTPPADEVRDTSGAGDAFNAGYLAARLAGLGPEPAVSYGQRLAREVIRHFGARIPSSDIPSFGS